MSRLVEQEPIGPISPEQILSKLGKMFPKGGSLVFLNGKEHKEFEESGNITLEDSYQVRIRDLNFPDGTGTNNSGMFFRYLKGDPYSGLWIYPDIDMMFEYDSFATVLEEGPTEDDEKGHDDVEYAQTPLEDDDPPPVVLLMNRRYFSPETQEEVPFTINKEDLVSELKFSEEQFVELANIVEAKTNEIYKKHIQYMRDEFQDLKDAPEEEVHRSSPYLRTALYTSDALQKGVIEYFEKRFKEWLISLVA